MPLYFKGFSQTDILQQLDGRKGNLPGLTSEGQEAKAPHKSWELALVGDKHYSLVKRESIVRTNTLTGLRQTSITLRNFADFSCCCSGTNGSVGSKNTLLFDTIQRVKCSLLFTPVHRGKKSVCDVVSLPPRVSCLQTVNTVLTSLQVMLPH